MMFGHVDADGPPAWARISSPSETRTQRRPVGGRVGASASPPSRRPGSTEFVPLPFVHFEAPVFRARGDLDADRRFASACSRTPWRGSSSDPRG